MNHNLKISNTYALYKTGHNKFTNWLKHTADACTKDTSSKTSKSKHASILPSSVAHYAEFQGLANTVVRTLLAEDIPYNIVNTLQNTIDLRRESFDFFRKQFEQQGHVNNAFLEKNDGHLHMIKVLVRVLKILNDKLKKAARRAESPDSSSQSMDKEETQIRNLFDVLNIQPTVERDSNVEEQLR